MKVRSIKTIKFWSLRTALGSGYGVIFDNDTLVTRQCRVVRVDDGLKWQLVKNKEYEHSYCNEEDQECLNETNIDDVEIVHESMVKFSNNGTRGMSMNEYDRNTPF